MNLLEKIESDLKESMKKGETLKTETLRMLKSDMMYEKGKTGKDLTDEKMIEAVSRAAKRRKESIVEFRKGKREDLAKKEEDELAIIEQYLPAQMSQSEVEGFIADMLKGMGTVTKKDLGRVMGAVMKEIKGKADGALVKELLTKKMDCL